MNLKKQMLLVLLGLNNSAQAQESPHDQLNTQVANTGAVAMGRPRRLPCQHRKLPLIFKSSMVEI